MNLKNENIIRDCIINRCQLSIERVEFDDQPICAIPISKSNSLILLKYVYDFHFDGFKVIPLNTISSINRGEIEIYHDKILKKEGIQIKNDIIKDIPIDNWNTFLKI